MLGDLIAWSSGNLNYSSEIFQIILKKITVHCEKTF